MDRVPLLSNAELHLARSVTIAARSLSLGGHDDFNQGQVSARLPGAQEFLIKSAITGFDQCNVEDVIRSSIDMDAPKHPQLPPEVVLHQAVYQQRPDVNAIVHSHAPYTLVFGATDIDLRAISHDGAFFQGRVPRFLLTSNTILTAETAYAVAAALGQNPAALLRNHGGVVVGKSIRHATVYAHLLERACQLQLTAEMLPGGYHSSPKDDIHAKRDFNFADLSVRSYWDWCQSRVLRQWPELGLK